ncbi:putative nuclease HARBI1 [Trematomus bernacchii]|uniref:putative nuclease HARBI1 n=1 Tax=Trematomus bernacchii TaxID=40690 RepID=UPI00146CB2A8|nr:putative nuclease HARBI1 [Trematomus bernacchii]
MTSPFVDDTVELGARILRGALRREGIFRDRQNPLAFSEEYLYERYRFSSEGLTYLCQLLEPYIANATRRSCALTVPQTVCIALRYFTTGSFLYAVGDAENLSKNTVCRLFSGVLLGDRGYACQPFLMTPYPDPDEGPQTSFNVAHAKTRVRIEITFGILKARFTCLRGLRVAPERACRFITACVVLHNIATMRKKRAPPANPQPPDVVDPITLDYPTDRAVREVS